MDPNELNELRELIEFLKASEVAEFELDKAELKVKLKFLGAVQAAAPPAAGLDVSQLARLMGSAAAVPAAPAAPGMTPQAQGATGEVTTGAAAPTSAAEEKMHVVNSPIVGTFYESPSPGSPAFVKVGDVVEVGQVLCIIEAMKLMNEIESDAAGEVVERIAASGQPVEYGQALFRIRAK